MVKGQGMNDREQEQERKLRSVDARYDRILLEIERLQFEVHKLVHAVRNQTTATIGVALNQEITMATTDEILTELAELPTINDSLDALFAQLQTLIQQGGQDPAKLAQALELITTQKSRTKASIVANTPASGETPTV